MRRQLSTLHSTLTNNRHAITDHEPITSTASLQVEDRVRTGLWVGDCFVFNNASWRLNYIVGGEVTVMFHLDRPMYLLGYIAAQQRVYLLDKQYAVVSYTLLLSLVEFKTLVMRDEMDEAYGMLDQIPEDHLDGCAACLVFRYYHAVLNCCGFATGALFSPIDGSNMRLLLAAFRWHQYFLRIRVSRATLRARRLVAQCTLSSVCGSAAFLSS